MDALNLLVAQLSSNIIPRLSGRQPQDVLDGSAEHEIALPNAVDIP